MAFLTVLMGLRPLYYFGIRENPKRLSEIKSSRVASALASHPSFLASGDMPYFKEAYVNDLSLKVYIMSRALLGSPDERCYAPRLCAGRRHGSVRSSGPPGLQHMDDTWQSSKDFELQSFFYIYSKIPARCY